MHKLLILPILFSLTPQVQAEIDPQIRENCLPAVDFLGCVKAYSNKSVNTNEREKIRFNTELIGNKCPEQYLYSGAGFCQLIVCKKNKLSHDIVLKNKDMYCKGMFKKIHLGKEFIKAIVDPRCPNKEPHLYNRSSCANHENHTNS